MLRNLLHLSTFRASYNYAFKSYSIECHSTELTFSTFTIRIGPTMGGALPILRLRNLYMFFCDL